MVSSGSSQGNLMSGGGKEGNRPDQKSPFEQYVQEAKKKNEDAAGINKQNR